MSNLPNDISELDAWITQQADFEPNHAVGKGWRYRALRSKDVPSIMAELPTYHRTSFHVRREEWAIVNKCVMRSGLSRSKFIGRALAEYMQRHFNIDPAELPHLTGHDSRS